RPSIDKSRIYYDIFVNKSDLSVDIDYQVEVPGVVTFMKRFSEEVGTTPKIWFTCSLWALTYLSAAATSTAAERALQLPTEAEIVKLRSTCAASGQQILEGNFIRSAVYQEQFSRYNPWTNRCYVEMRIYTNDPNNNSERFGQFLYDGQTREMLAFAQIQN